MKNNQCFNKIHFIGIGGIGVSGLAQFYIAQGVQVSGSDLARNETTVELEKLGAKIFIGQRKENLTGLSKSDLVIYSAAIQKSNQELTEARTRGLKCETYAQALGELTKKYFTIAVSGTHGKSTTTAMIGLILEAAGLDPTVIVGTKVRWNDGRISNFRPGSGKYLVIEADEYAASFLNYWPKVIVLTNIEEDHLDFYTGGLPQIMKTFEEYVGHLGSDGVLVANEEDKNVMRIYLRSRLRQGYGGQTKFKTQNYNSKVKISGLNLKIPGRHNLSNASAAITAAKILGIADDVAVKALNNFIGTWRRMEYKGEVNGARIYDDYGHHPTEIKATLQGARELIDKMHAPSVKLRCVFQPHQYQRTYKLFDKFINAFTDADETIILPIYSVAGREKEEIKRKISSQKLVEAMRNAGHKNTFYLGSLEEAKEYLKNHLKAGDLAIIMGAGDVYKLTGTVLGRQKPLK